MSSRPAPTRLLLTAALLAASALWLPRPAAADVYKYVDGNGVVNYTDRRPTSDIDYQVIVLDPRRAAQLDWSSVPLNLTEYSREINAACRDSGVDASLVRAVIHAESWFNSDAVSRRGAEGLMQLTPGTQRRFDVHNAFDAWDNIRGGVRYLSELLTRFNGDVRLATAAYNAGENAVLRYGGIPPYPETRQYVQRVVTLEQRYRQAL